MNEIYWLKLPPPPPDIEQALIKLADAIPPNLEEKEYQETFHKNQFAVVSQHYSHNTPMPPHVHDRLQEIYQPYFRQPFGVSVSKLENMEPGTLAQSPPQCDAISWITINYVLESGGNEVLTCFYINPRFGDDYAVAEYRRHADLELDYRICLPDRVWHMYNAQQYYSVENIQNNRLVFGIHLIDNPSLEEFKKIHRHLL
jgi:hypothetical protein